MKIYLVCPVRNGVPDDVYDYVRELEEQGHTVHFPPRDVCQEDDTGLNICKSHLSAMRCADTVHVMWDVNSKGSHFDIGMAFALDKPIIPVKSYHADNEGKSYWKVINSCG